MTDEIEWLPLIANDTRRRILAVLAQHALHISGLAREVGVSAPVALRHIRRLEDAALVTRTPMGNQHVISLADDAEERLGGVWSLIAARPSVQVTSGTSLADALTELHGVRFATNPLGTMVVEVDGVEGDYVYEVDGRLPHDSLDRHRVDHDVTVRIKRLVPYVSREVRVHVIPDDA